MASASDDGAPAGLLQSGGTASHHASFGASPARPVSAVSVAVEQETSSVLRIAEAARHAGREGRRRHGDADVAGLAPRLAWHLDETVRRSLRAGAVRRLRSRAARMDIAVTGHGAAAPARGATATARPSTDGGSSRPT